MTLQVQRFAAIAGTIALVFGAFKSAEAVSQTLVIGNEGTYPPFSIIAPDGHLTGFEPELARAMCERMKAECKIEPMDFNALLPSMVTGKIDMIASAMWPTPERLEKTEFSTPIFYNPNAFVVPKSWNKGYTPEDFSGVKVGVIAGTSQAAYLAREVPGAQVVTYKNPNQIFLDLAAGRVEAAFGGKLTWNIILNDNPAGSSWKTSEQEFWDKGKPVGVSWAVQKGNVELIQKVNAAISSLLADCTYTKLRKRFIPVQTSPEEPKSCL